jgi:hypothetical protein
MTRRLSGIVRDPDGQYVMATMVRGRDGWRVGAVRRWLSCAWRNQLLVGRGVVFGVRTHWNTGELRAGEAGTIEAPAQEQFGPRAYAADLDANVSALKRNMLGVVSEDVALCALPSCLDTAPSVYLSVLETPSSFVIGAVADGSLRFVVRMAPSSPDTLTGHLARVRRYLLTRGIAPSLPMPVYVLCGALPESSDEFVFRALPIRTRGRDAPWSPSEVRAAGVALSALLPHTMRFAGPSPESGSRRIRTVLYATAAAIGLVSLGLLGWALAATRTAGQRLTEARARYEATVAGSVEAGELLRSNTELAQRVLAIQGTFSRQTRWSELLGLLAQSATPDLRLEALGSEPVQGDATRMRIALAGSATRETAVTDFIAILQKVPYLGDFPLPVLERDERRKGVRFRLVCTLQLCDSQ